MIVTPAQNSIIKIKTFDKLIYLHSTLQSNFNSKYIRLFRSNSVFALFYIFSKHLVASLIQSAHIQKNGAFAQNSLLSPLYNII